MIQLELTTALALYSAVLAALGAGIWIYTEFSVLRPQRNLGRQFLWRCVYCGYSYLDEHADRLSQCPRCESYNTVEEKEGRQDPNLRHAVESAPGDERPKGRRNPSIKKRPHQRRRGPRRRR